MDHSFKFLAPIETSAAEEAWQSLGRTHAPLHLFEEWGHGAAHQISLTAQEAMERASEAASMAELVSHSHGASSATWKSEIARALREGVMERSKLQREIAQLSSRIASLEERLAQGAQATSQRAPSWRETHAHELRAYAGRYVAWGANGVVASAGSHAALLEQLEKLGIRGDLAIEYVPRGPRAGR